VNSKISEKDKKTWEEFLSNGQKLPDKDNIQNKKIIKKTRSLDLHGKTLDEANSIIENFIKKSYEEKVQKLIIITGKGLHSNNEKDPYVSMELGILKYSIPEFVRNNKNLMQIISNIGEASVKDGGTGAFYIFLKRK
jgi:DNA-nicking Smr family endonuclease